MPGKAAADDGPEIADSALVLQSHILKIAATAVVDEVNLAMVARQTNCLLGVLAKTERLELRL